jgi:hypothetical protein
MQSIGRRQTRVILHSLDESAEPNGTPGEVKPETEAKPETEVSAGPENSKKA